LIFEENGFLGNVVLKVGSRGCTEYREIVINLGNIFKLNEKMKLGKCKLNKKFHNLKTIKKKKFPNQRKKLKLVIKLNICINKSIK